MENKVDSKIIEEVFESKQKMPETMKKEAMKSIMQNMIMALILVVMLIVICFMGEKLVKDTWATGLKVISTILVMISIVLFEISYRKEKANTAFWAGELMIFGLAMMFVPYLNQYVQTFLIAVASIFGGYYLLKFLAIVLHKQKQFSDKKSDIKDLVKDDKKSYLDEVSTKKFNK